MKIKAINLKNWCDAQISPFAWKRIVLRSLTIINELDYDLETFEEPGTDLMISGQLLDFMLVTIHEMYKIDIPVLEEIK